MNSRACPNRLRAWLSVSYHFRSEHYTVLHNIANLLFSSYVTGCIVTTETILLTTAPLQAPAAEEGPDLHPRAILPEAGDTMMGGTPLEAMSPTGGGNQPQIHGGAIAEITKGPGAGAGAPGQIQGRLLGNRSFPRSSHATKMI